jgi:hypothetical protein
VEPARKLPRAGRQARTRDAPRAAPRWEAGAEAQGTHGGPGAALSQKVGARAAGTHDSPRVAPSRSIIGCFW